MESKQNNYLLCYENLCKKFAARSIEEITETSGAFYDSKNSQFNLKYFNREYLISYPSGDVTFKNSNDNNLFTNDRLIHDKILIMSYLCRCSKIPLSNKWVPYREIEGVGDSYDFFSGFGTSKLADFFGNKGDLFLKVGNELDAKKASFGDLSLQFNIFPNLPVTLVLWLADDEFKAEANIFFDSSASKQVHIEDLASLCSRCAEELIKRAEKFL